MGLFDLHDLEVHFLDANSIHNVCSLRIVLSLPPIVGLLLHAVGTKGFRQLEVGEMKKGEEGLLVK